MLSALLADQSWVKGLAQSQPKAAALLSRSDTEQIRLGYFHTLREIYQQPITWLNTAEKMIASAPELRECVRGIQALVLTGSGSSEFAGHCVRAALRRELDVVTEVIGGGTLLAYGEAAVPPGRPLLAVSLARSGDSPESIGAISRLLENQSEIRHLVLTCNREGRVADTFREHPDAHVIPLDDATNDRSLVMTSSFTNLVLAVRCLGMIDSLERYRHIVVKLSQAASDLLRSHLGTAAKIAAINFRRAIYLGSGPRLGCARESALKMLEMTAGSVATLCDSYLGFRHGPMSFAHSDTLIVCFLSSDPILRAYECDLLGEIDDKGLGLMKVIVGSFVPTEAARKNDVIIECSGLSEIADDDSTLIHVIVGQMLAFFRCLEQGLRPDSPSENGVINRVVQSFKLHLPHNVARETNGERNL